LIFFRKPSKPVAQLNFQEWGDGNRCIVFLHGLGGTLRYWQTGSASIKLTNKKAHYIFVDLLGFGDSPKPTCRYTLDQHVNALSAVIGQFKSVEIVGHSLGAAIALAYAARHPKTVKRLVLISLPYFHDQKSAYRWLRRKPSGWLYTNMFVTALVCIFSRRIVGRLLPLLITSVPKPIVRDLVKHTFISSTASLWNVLYQYDLEKEASSISEKTDVICIHASDDNTAPLLGVSQLISRHLSWKLITCEQGGHHLWFTQTTVCHLYI